MRRIILVLVAAFTANFSMAQSTAVASAYNYLKMGSPDLAKDEIDKAIINDATKADAKTWFYRGNIYLQLYTFSTMTIGIEAGISAEDVVRRLGEPESKRNFKKLENGERWFYPNALEIYLANGIVDHYEFPGEQNYKAKDDGKLLETAYQCYKKTIELDPSFIRPELVPQNAEIGLDRIARLLYNQGIENFQAQKSDEALVCFEKANSIFSELGTSDDNLILYTGFAAETIKDSVKAIKYYSQLVEKKNDNPNLYMSLAYLYIGKKDFDKALNVVQTGKSILPENQNLLLTEANIYLQADRAKEAESILKVAAERDPNNAQLQFAIGANYDKMVNDSSLNEETKIAAFNAGKQAYLKALSIKPDYFDAAYNLGALLNNKAAAAITEANNLPLSATEKYDELIKMANELLLEAKPYLQKCHELQPTDRNTMIMLRGIYSQTKDTENLKLINQKLK